MQTLKPSAFGLSLAVLSAVVMLLLGLFGRIGIDMGSFEMMRQWHMFFSSSIGGIVAGMAEAAIISFVFGYAFAFLYNKLM